MANKTKHLIYAEDLLWELMQYPDSTLNTTMIKSIIETCMLDNEVKVGRVAQFNSWTDNDDDGDIYD